VAGRILVILKTLCLFNMLSIWPKKHRYTAGYPDGRCIYCGRQTGLDAWQLKELPKEMAMCPKGESATILEIFTDSYDTLQGD
jgi:hypothetical protein